MAEIKYSQLTDIDRNIIKNIETGFVFKKKYARFKLYDTATYHEVYMRKKQLAFTNNEKYFKWLGFDGFCRGNMKDDSEIENILKNYEDPDRKGWVCISDVPDEYTYYDYLTRRAYNNNMNLTKLVNFFGYKREIELIKDMLVTATERYKQDILNSLSKKNDGTYTIKSHMPIYSKIDEFTRIRQINLKRFLEILITKWKQDGIFIEPIPEYSNKLISKNVKVFENDSRKITEFNEEDIERILSMDDDSVGYKFGSKFTKYRVYNKSIINNLKEHYKGKCQLCGEIPHDSQNIDITEAHHIEYFSRSLNNNADNIIIVCPNHHRLLHKLHATYDRGRNEFVLSNRRKIKVSYDLHLNINNQSH